MHICVWVYIMHFACVMSIQLQLRKIHIVSNIFSRKLVVEVYIDSLTYVIIQLVISYPSHFLQSENHKPYMCM